MNPLYLLWYFQFSLMVLGRVLELQYDRMGSVLSIFSLSTLYWLDVYCYHPQLTCSWEAVFCDLKGFCDLKDSINLPSV